MGRIRIPANNWQPRQYQLPFWRYLEGGGKRAVAVWHRRSGKDDVALNWTCVAANDVGAPGSIGRRANYWHMLPEAAQARKALWDAVNPVSGKRRIDEAFPQELREATRDNEMLIRFRSGSTYQVVGSDNYESLIGSPPAGIIFSEWAKAKPQAWAMLSPILMENSGWAIFPYTPRGRNHGLRLLETARKSAGWFHEVLTVDDTKVFEPVALEQQRQELYDIYGPDFGEAIFQQEFYCSFSAPILGAIYANELARVEREGRICSVPHDPDRPVFTAWDLGFTDDTAIWWFQVIAGEIHVLEFYEASGKNVAHYASQILGRTVTLDIVDNELVCKMGDFIPELEHRRHYNYQMHWLPRDAKARTLAAMGKSVIEQLAKALTLATLSIVPSLSVEDGIQAARMVFHRCYFDADGTEDGIEALRNYQREWNDERRELTDKPKHDWTSHAADSLRMLALAWRDEIKDEKPDPMEPVRRLLAHRITLNELFEQDDLGRSRHQRI